MFVYTHAQTVFSQWGWLVVIMLLAPVWESDSMYEKGIRCVW